MRNLLLGSKVALSKIDEFFEVNGRVLPVSALEFHRRIVDRCRQVMATVLCGPDNIQ